MIPSGPSWSGFQITGVMKIPSEMMIGSTCWRSRIWMMRLDTAKVIPAANTTSITMNIGTHTVATLGARPKMTKSKARGIQEITVLSAVTSMVSSGKHSRGNCVLARSALFVRSELPPLPSACAKKLQHKMPTNA